MRLGRALLAAGALVAFCGFLALGVWQVERRAWKHALVARVEARVQAPPVDAPGPDRWATVTADHDGYRHVRLQGRFLHDRETLVQATTALGAGFWVLTPLQRPDGNAVLVNRGFVPPERRAPDARGTPAPEGDTTVVGLLRTTEPGGGFLRQNDPAADRWHSRDVAAIAAARGLGPTAPYFVDADAPAGAVRGDIWPAPGLTTVAFADNHLVYALTWWALAAMVAGAAVYVVRHDRRAARSRAAVVHPSRPAADARTS